jgi:hypothetical protein
MSTRRAPEEELLARVLESRGLEADPERNAAVAPALRSLLGRLLRLREALPSGAAPPPQHLDPPARG